MATGLDLVKGALRMLGVLASGEQPSFAEAEDARNYLNDMIATWNIERGWAFTTTMTPLTLAAGKQSYTVGPEAGNDLVMDRPYALEPSFVVVDASGSTLPLTMLTSDDWAGLNLKSTASTFPTAVYYDTSIPDGTLYFWPIPNTAPQVQLWVTQAISSFADLNTEFVAPNGYLRAIRANLALELAADYGVSVSQEVAAIASDAKMSIKRVNAPDLRMSVDPALVVDKGGGYNWLTDGYGWS